MRKEMFSEINRVLINISSALNVERSTVLLINEEKGTLDSLISQGIRNNLISMPQDCGIAGLVASTGKAQIVNEVSKREEFNPYYDSITGFKTIKILCTPIFTDSNQVIGVIQSLNKINGLFDKRDLEILQSFASVISLAIKNANLYASAEAIKNDISTLLKVSSSINSELDLTNLIKLIIQKASEITQSDRSSFFLLNEEEGFLWTKYAEGLGTKIIRTKKGLASLVAKTKRPLIENNPYSNPHFDKTIDVKLGYQTKSIVSIPVFNGSNKLLGVIQSINKKKGVFTNKDLFILNGFASQISIAVQNSTLFEEINEIKNYLNILFENLDNGILTIDKNGIIKTVNKRFCEIIGTNQNRLVGKYYKNLDHKYFSFLEYSDYTFRSGEKFEKQNVESLDLNNQKLVFNFNSLPMHNKRGKKLGVINVIQDITYEERVRENLNRYLPQHVINEIISKDDLSVFNGKYRTCTILFSDIRNFTSLAEELEAIDVVNFLNNYFDTMVDSVIKNNGVLDKLIGDAVMATFGIPYQNKNDASNSANTAMEMIQNLEYLNNVQNFHSKINIGIGIATGDVISGNIGSKKRFEYTVIGDSVNLASRLESLTKFYGTNILICENTFKKIETTFICREIDTIKVKGKQKPVSIYTIEKKITDTLSKEEELFLKFYSEGLNFYRKQKFNEAIKSFNQVLLFNSNDKPVQILLARCRDFIISPPENDWRGTWAFSKK
ncbi:MAG: adenylate/guanylate cyclase domain-containing protein [Saprospiraceae bacterium]